VKTILKILRVNKMAKFMIGVPYLTGEDVNPDGSLKPHVGNGKAVVLMMQGNFCPHCTTAKPAFQQLAKMGVGVATVQTDGDDGDRAAAKKFASVNKSPGVPAFLGFDKNGRFVKMHEGGRDVQSLQAFYSSL
jgi:thiol-disulfide isomerase/thioredoxin